MRRWTSAAVVAAAGLADDPKPPAPGAGCRSGCQSSDSDLAAPGEAHYFTCRRIVMSLGKSRSSSPPISSALKWNVPP